MLAGAAPSDTLDFGLNINYVGDTASVTADLSVQAPVVDSTPGTTPPRRRCRHD